MSGYVTAVATVPVLLALTPAWLLVPVLVLVLVPVCSVAAVHACSTWHRQRRRGRSSLEDGGDGEEGKETGEESDGSRVQ